MSEIDQTFGNTNNLKENHHEMQKNDETAENHDNSPISEKGIVG